MSASLPLNNPWMVAVWPGMGHVALNAGVYLLAKLGMSVVGEYETGDLFDVDSVEVKDGIIQPGKRPRNRFFLWNDPDENRDLILFLGEAQPPMGKYPFCKQVVRSAQQFGVDRLFTFAAMATPMPPDGTPRVFAAATDEATLTDLQGQDVEVLTEGNISGLNGVLLGAAVEGGLHGGCLLGEMPHIFAQLPVPKASLAILRVFTRLSGIAVDLDELEGQAETVDRQLTSLISNIDGPGDEDDESDENEDDESDDDESDDADAEPIDPELRPAGLLPAEAGRIEELFAEAGRDRSRAFELKRELDRLGAFKEYEDRFLDLFKKL